MTTENGALLEQEMDFDPTLSESIDQDSVEGGGPRYPVIQWVGGEPRNKKFGPVMEYLGGFFIKAGTVDGDALTAAGWTKTSRTFSSGADEEGFWKREAVLSIIASRRRWEVKGAGDGPRKNYPWNAYDAAKEAGRPSARGHYLVLIKGLEDLGPFVLTLSGSARRAMDDYRNSHAVLSRFAATVITAANNASAAAAKGNGKPPARWAYRAFWCPIGADRDAKGEPVYINVSPKGVEAKFVVLPAAIGLPDKAEGVDLKRFFVGKELLAKVNDLATEAHEWVKAWDTIEPGSVDGHDANAADEKAEAVHQAQTAREDANLAAMGL